MNAKYLSILLAGISVFALNVHAGGPGGDDIRTVTSKLLSCELSANLNNLGINKIDFYQTNFTGSALIAYTQQIEFQFAGGQTVRYDSLSGFGNLQDMFRMSLDRTQILGFGLSVRGRPMGASVSPTGTAGTSTLFLSASPGGRNHDVFDCK